MKFSSFFSSLSRISKHIELYGKEGFMLWKSKLAKNEQLKTYKLRDIAHEVYLREGTSDYETFVQVFFDKQYAYTLDSQPKYIIDCGANIGLATIYFANQYPDATIIAVEPESSNYDVLKLNTAPYKNVHCLKNGIYNKKTHLKVEDSGLGKWGFTTVEVDSAEAGTISALSIGDIKKIFSIDRIDIVKIDIEGSEKQLFKDNFSGWLGNTGLIIIELHDRTVKGTAKAFFDALHDYDYTLEIKGENIFCEINS